SLGTPTTLTGPRFGGDVTFTPGVTNTLPGGFSFGITNSEVNSLITALTTKGQVKLLQAPKIMCLNGTNAIISVTQNYPYIIPEYEEIYNDQGVRTGTRQTVNTYEEDVGTEFIVTPVILRNRNVFLNLQIYDSRLVEIKKLSAVAANLRYETEQPIISTRETSQNVTLFDGQTLVVGGMIQERKEFSQTAVPFLHKIPLLGYLFKKPRYTSTRDELLLFLTPRVVTTYEEAETVSRPDLKKGEKEIDTGILKHF
ncbi:MAG TPA: type II and III secretion system protein, partial [bacterium]|nr:type II and III secretion system protein [bacterium]